MNDPNINQVLIALRRIIRATDIHSRTLIKTTGLTAPQLILLQTLAAGQANSVGEVAQEMSLSQATVTTIVDRLENRALLRREKSSQDKRRVNLVLTEAGREAAIKAPTPLQADFVREFQSLQDWEQAMLVSALQRVAQMMHAEGLDASPLLDIGSPTRMGDQD